MVNFEQWNGFDGSLWKEEVNVRDFIQKNYKPYDGDEHFLAGPTDATNKLWGVLQGLQKKSAPRAAFWIWTRRSCPALLPMSRATSVRI